MTEQGEWDACGQPTTQSAPPPPPPQLMSPMTGKSKPLGVPVTQNMASLLSTILEQMDD